MLTNIAKKIFGSRNDRLLKQYRKTAAAINALEAGMQALSDEELAGKTAQFKKRLAEGETLDSILPEAFAVCREASRRILGMRHFDVQLIGGMVLHDGKIAEMRRARNDWWRTGRRGMEPRHPKQHGPLHPPNRLRQRHHLRHKQRIRLRLPARQHGNQPL